VKPLEAHALADVDPVRPVERAEPVRGLGRRDALEDAVGHLDERDLKPALRRDRRRLEPDVAAAHDQHAAAFGEFRRHGVDIGQRAHGVDAGERPADGRAAGGAPSPVTRAR
jgi:hypothetical protein